MISIEAEREAGSGRDVDGMPQHLLGCCGLLQRNSVGFDVLASRASSAGVDSLRVRVCCLMLFFGRKIWLDIRGPIKQV